jgi:DNA topoisomerase-1
MTEIEKKATGWRAVYNDGKWVEQLAAKPAKKKSAAKKKAAKKKSAAKKKAAGKKKAASKKKSAAKK